MIKKIFFSIHQRRNSEKRKVWRWNLSHRGSGKPLENKRTPHPLVYRMIQQARRECHCLLHIEISQIPMEESHTFCKYVLSQQRRSKDNNFFEYPLSNRQSISAYVTCLQRYCRRAARQGQDERLRATLTESPSASSWLLTRDGGTVFVSHPWWCLTECGL